MMKIAHNIKKYKYLIGCLLIIITSIIFLFFHYKRSDIYIYYDKNIKYCKFPRDNKKEEYIICFNNSSYSFKVKNANSVRIIDNLKKIKLTSLEELFNNSRRNKNLFLIVKKDNKYKILPVKMYQNLS
ncbi:hypothetical protein V1T75_16370 [Tenacibaculum sp. FZY0031]|uniref:hypothetical protein n=1 Tax=Tenacibaculum sp. FZY0031 TaxID=3116648 RepID=UPI002EC2C926|nr:hypothetical protein [Tenacibaculum sp. FZY0031]